MSRRLQIKVIRRRRNLPSLRCLLKAWLHISKVGLCRFLMICGFLFHVFFFRICFENNFLAWSIQELALFEQGLVSSQKQIFSQKHFQSTINQLSQHYPKQIYGRGNWTKISGLIKTRTPLQVKNHARLHFKRVFSLIC